MNREYCYNTTSMQPDQNQYEFIMDSSQGKSSGPAFLQDPKKRNIFAGLFVGVILLFAMLIFAIVSSIGNGSTSAMIDVAAYQTELVRISTLGLVDAKEPTIRAKAATMQMFMQSDLTNTTTYLSGNGKKLEPKDTAIRLSTEVNKAFESAKLRNTFDQELLDAFEATSKDYKLSLQQAIDSASSDAERALLKTAAENIILFEGS
jgi:hypothetical protein